MPLTIMSMTRYTIIPCTQYHSIVLKPFFFVIYKFLKSDRLLVLVKPFQTSAMFVRKATLMPLFGRGQKGQPGTNTGLIEEHILDTNAGKNRLKLPQMSN